MLAVFARKGYRRAPLAGGSVRKVQRGRTATLQPGPVGNNRTKPTEKVFKWRRKLTAT